MTSCSPNQIIKVDFTNLHSNALGIGRGMLNEDAAIIHAVSEASDRAVKKQYNSGVLPYLDLHKQDISEILSYAKSVKGKFENIAVLGIGGSALGLTCLNTALNNYYYNSLSFDARGGYPRLFVMDNIDPEMFADFLSITDVSKTLFVVISKSGSTAETMSQYIIVRELLEQNNLSASENMVIITDAKKGILRKVVEKDGIKSFEVPDGVGGRFSVLTPVGLLPAALIGIDIVALLQGAGYFSEYALTCDVDQNPALQLASMLFLLSKKGYKNHVLMPYSSKLKDFADWYRQLWAESLGKRVDRTGRVIETGVTPIKALGVTDQHSQVQLYVEGPRDKVVVFLEVEGFSSEVTIPAIEGLDEDLQYLQGKSLNKLINAEMLGTMVALTDAGRPNCKISINKISPQAIGQLFVLWELAVSYTGEMMNINAYDQPGVEAGKRAAYGLMGRPGFEEEAKRILGKL